ncbi:hypothetical protein LguiA_014141 [Lonicera macranthoides]
MDLRLAREDLNRFNESKRIAETVKAQAELELIEANETVKSLSSTIEVMRELEFAKQELAKLKLNKASMLQEKIHEEKKAEASSLKMASHLFLVDALRNEIEQINEEKMLVELGTFEALREYEAIQAQRITEAQEYSSKTDQTIKKVNDIKALEMKLAATNLEVNEIKSELELAKGKKVELNALEKAKKELISIKEQGFKFMESMDVVRIELKNVKETISLFKRAEEKAHLALGKMNSKLLRAKAKLEEISGAEQRAKSLTSNLSLTLQQLKVEAEKSTKDAKFTTEECSKIKGEVSRMEYERELNQRRLDGALRELEEVKLSESKAIGELSGINEKTLRTRVKNFHDMSRITISNFEYKYLKGREVEASEIADKKVASAQVLIEALKASEREAFKKAEMVKREIRAASRAEEEEVETESAVKREKIVGVVTPSPRRTMNRGGHTRTPTRRGKFVKGSPSNQNIYRSPSFVVKKRREVMPSLAKFFSRKSIERGL